MVETTASSNGTYLSNGNSNTSATATTTTTTTDDAVDKGIEGINQRAHLRARGDKIIHDLVHVFDELDDPKKRMEALARKYLQLAAEKKTNDQKVLEQEKEFARSKKDLDHLHNDYNKAMVAKEKFENLCRELQKMNKQIKEETAKYSEEEEKKRSGLTQKFQTTIADITAQMGENHNQNQQLQQDNSTLAAKMKGLIEQYEVREQHIEKVLHAKSLELQLCEAKVQQQNLIEQEEMETHLREKKDVLEESLIYKKKYDVMVKTEAELRQQLALYTKKFEEFQSTLSQSNDVFVTFKKDMDSMTETIQRLEKESSMWKGKWEDTNRDLLAMVGERAKNEETIEATGKKIAKLEKLCRVLQGETSGLRKKLGVEKDKAVAEAEVELAEECELTEADKEMKKPSGKKKK